MLKRKKRTIHHYYDDHLAYRDYEGKIPLPGTMMIVSLIGMAVVLTYTLSGRMNQWFLWAGPERGYAFGTAFFLVFLFIFIASVVSITPSNETLKKIEQETRQLEREIKKRKE